MASKHNRVVIVGGGFGGLFTALNLSGTGEVTLLSNEDHFLFTPMLYEYMSREVEAWQIAPPYQELLGESVNFIHGTVTGIDFPTREVAIEEGRQRIAYNILVLAVGSVSNFEGVAGTSEHALPFRKLADADALRERMVATIDRISTDSQPQEARRAATFVVVGGGASGVEVSTKMADLLHKAFARRGLPGEPRALILELEDKIVPGMDDKMRAHVEEALKKSRVEVQSKAKVLQVTASGVHFEHDGKETDLEAAAVVWAGGVAVNPLVKKLDLEKEKKRSLIVVEQTLQARGYENVFALGDIAHYANADKELDGTAQLAYQQAGLVAHNVRALLSGENLETKYFKEMGTSVSLGTESAAVEVGGHVIAGALGREARFAMYTARLPTWHHRLRVGPSWFFGGNEPQLIGGER